MKGKSKPKERETLPPDLGTPFSRKFETPEDLYQKCREYFEIAEQNGKALTKIGLRLFLNIGKQTWLDYCRREGFAPVCEWADAKLESWLEEKLLTDNKPIGAIFQLKSVHGRTDQPVAASETKNYVYMFGNEWKELMKRNQTALAAPHVLEEEPVTAEPRRKRNASRLAEKLGEPGFALVRE